MKQASISFAVVLAVTLSVAGVVPALAQPVGATADGPVVAVVVDDAHVRFVDTVQMRRVIRDVVDRLLPDGSLMSLASTGRWSTPLDPTFEKGKVDGKVNQLMGLRMHRSCRRPTSRAVRS
jgi:hypothetical protein